MAPQVPLKIIKRLQFLLKEIDSCHSMPRTNDYVFKLVAEVKALLGPALERLKFLLEEIERYHVMASGFWGIPAYTPKEMNYIQERVAEVQTLLGCLLSEKHWGDIPPGASREEWIAKFDLVVERAKGWADAEFM